MRTHILLLMKFFLSSFLVISLFSFYTSANSENKTGVHSDMLSILFLNFELVQEEVFSQVTSIQLFVNQKIKVSQLDYSINESTTWSISGTNLNLSGTGLGLLDVVLTTPGQFLVQLHTHEGEGTCNHASSAQITVQVLPYNIVFDLENAWFSDQFENGHNTIILKIPATVEESFGTSFPFQNLSIKAAGINTTVEGQFVSQLPTAGNANFEVEFLLEGSCESDTYIMLDLFFNNSTIATYNVSYKIN